MTEEIRTYPTELPLVPLREMVVFPKIVQPLGVGRQKSVAAIDAAMADEKHYVISIAASLAGCHPRTLRIYEEEGLVEPVRTDSNIRLYSDEDLQRVRIIRYLTQRRGVNLAGVKMLLGFREAADLLRELANAIDEDEDPASDHPSNNNERMEM